MKVFISYRRGDAQDFAGRLADRLRAHDRIDSVFLDVASINPGENFPEKLTDALLGCQVCLVVIGRDWLGDRLDGKPPRIKDSSDFVRMEVREALAGGTKAYPILANGASMPETSELPSDLAALVQLNAISVRHSDFDRDVEHLINVILGQAGESGCNPAHHSVLAILARTMIGAALGLFALIVVGLVHQTLTGLSLSQTVGGAGPTTLLMGAIPLAGALLANLQSLDVRGRSRKSGPSRNNRN